MNIRLEVVITAVLVACAVTTTSLVIHRAIASRNIDSRLDTRAKYNGEWRSYLPKGVLIGPSTAPVHLLEFADFECPFCGNFHKTLRVMRDRYPTQVAVTFIHFPLPGHRFAMPAARVAECAGDQGRFREMYDQLFDRQDQLGLKPWSDYATDAGVPDIAAFDACIRKTDPIPRAEEGKALGAKLDVQGTPTIFINGWKLGHPPTDAELDQMVQRILAGNSPVDGKS